MKAMRIALALLVCVFASLIAACLDESAWKLEGEVAFIELRESLSEEGKKTGSLDYAIRNVGKSRIEGTSFSFSFSTDKKSYHFTIADANAIDRGALVYGRVDIAYDGADESGSLAAAVIDSVRFE